MAKSNLPQEILMEIFSRLPAKSVGRCRCLSKDWAALLSAPQFVKAHLNRKPTQQHIIILTNSCIHTFPAIKDRIVSRKLNLTRTWSPVGSCDGLVLFSNELLTGKSEMMLMNPITQEQVIIPKAPLVRQLYACSVFGFGYDSSMEDYKIVKINGQDTEAYAYVFSMKMGEWKRVMNTPKDHAITSRAGVFLNGAIYWLASRRGSDYLDSIAVFDLVNEEFNVIPHPMSHCLEFGELVVLADYLCIFDTHSNGRIASWIMKESWTRFSIPAEYRPCCPLEPLCSIGHEDVLLLTLVGLKFAVYNQKEKTFRYTDVVGIEGNFGTGGTFVESLISPAFRRF